MPKSSKLISHTFQYDHYCLGISRRYFLCNFMASIIDNSLYLKRSMHIIVLLVQIKFGIFFYLVFVFGFRLPPPNTRTVCEGYFIVSITTDGLTLFSLLFSYLYSWELIRTDDKYVPGGRIAKSKQQTKQKTMMMTSRLVDHPYWFAQLVPESRQFGWRHG